MSLDLDAYFARIGYGGATEATPATLAALHEAQVGAIPFENIDVLLGRPLDLGPEGIAAKLVARGRGGYCYEQNLLFAAVLDRLGFAVTPLAARVRKGFTAPRPRTHALLKVSAGGADWIADCGFGSLGLLQPLPLDVGARLDLPLVSFRLAADGGLYVMQAKVARESWQDLYVFSLEPQHEVDFVMANHYTSTWPRSPFVRSLIVSKVTRARRVVLLDRQVSETTAERTHRRELASAAELFALLGDEFGLKVSDTEIAARAFAEKEPWG